MRDLAENLGILVSHRPQVQGAGTYNTRANGVHNTAGEIDLADYNYPRRLLVIVTVGEWIEAGVKLDVTILSGNVSGMLWTTEKIFEQMIAEGEQIYELETTQRFLNIKCVVTNIQGSYLNFAVILVTDHARYGNMGSDD